MKNSKALYVLLLMLGLLSGLISCAPGTLLSTRGGGDSQINGNYTVIYYGCNFFNDLSTIAFLVKEGGGYSFEPYAPDFQYKVKKGLSADEAVETAGKFVNCNASFSRAQIDNILGPNGETIGHEVRPLYRPLTYGVDNVLSVEYRLKDGKVVINVRLLPSVEMMLESSGGSPREK